MLYLVKMQRCAGNHQYIIGIYRDEDIAHFKGEYHQKFIRGGHKYYYIVEPLNFVSESCYIVSWENNDETLRYRVYHDKDHAMKNTQTTDYKHYRFKCKEYLPSDYEYDDDEIEEAAQYWHFFEGKEIVGLQKLYKHYLDKLYKNKFDK